MRIRAIESFHDEFVGFVRVTDEEGGQGWGQVSTYNADISCAVLHRQVAPWTLGRDCTDLDDLLARVTEREHKFPGSYLRRAMAGLDTAVWDLRGRRAGRSVAELLGGSAGPVRAYASSMKRDIAPREEAARLRRLADERGFTAFKVRVGAEVGRGADEWPGRTEEIVPLMRRELGDGAALMADANSCYDPPRAIEVGRLLEAHGYAHFEEPCPYWELDQTRAVADALDIDVAGGEQDCDLPTWRRMLDTRTVDVAQPDVCYLGGLSRTLAVARMAETAGLVVTPHAANLSLVTLFTMHLLRALPNGGPYVELSIEGPDYYPWQAGLFVEDPYRVDDGQVTVEERPGWGVEIAPEWLARSTYRRSAS